MTTDDDLEESNMILKRFEKNKNAGPQETHREIFRKFAKRLAVMIGPPDFHGRVRLLPTG